MFDRNQPFTEVEAPASTLDRSKPFDEVSRDEGLTNALFDLDGAPSRVGPEGKAAFAALETQTDNSKETKAQAVNQAYVQREMGIAAPDLQQDWPAFRDSFARSALGHTEGEISETKFYDLATKAEQKSLKQNWSEGGVWDRLKMMFGSQGFGQTEVKEFSIPVGAEAAGVKGDVVTIPKMEGTGTMVGLINAANKFTASLFTPENAAIAVGTGGVGVLAELVPLTRAAIVLRSTQAAGLGTFTAIGAKDTVNAAAEAKIIFNDPKATNADKADAIATVVLSGAMTIAAAKGTYDFAGAAKAEATAVDANAARMESIRHLREEAAKSEPKTAETLNKVADEIEALAPIVEEKPPAKAGEATVEDLDGGGFVVTDKDGNRAYAQDRAEADALAKELGAESQTKGNDRAAYEQVQKEMADMGHDKAGTPEYNELWQKSEDIKNRNEGMPPEQKAEPVKEVRVTEAAKTPEEVQSVVKSAEQAVVGIKNASVDEALAKMGLEPATHGERLSFEEARQDAAKKMEKDPLAGQKLIQQLEAEPRPVSGKENALLLHELTRLTNERVAAETALIEAQKMGDPQDIADAKVRVQQAQADYVKAADIDTKVGTANAIGLSLRRMMMKEDYSLASMERRRMVANEGKALSEAQRAEVSQLHERIAATQKAFDDYVASQNKVVPFPKQGKVALKLSERATEARARISERLLKASGESFVEGEKSGLLSKEMLNDLGTVGADLIARGAKEFGKWSEEMVKEFGEKIKPHLKAIFDKAAEVKSDEARLSAKKTRLETGTAKLKEKAEAGDFSKPERKPIHLDEEANRLQAEYDLAKMEYDRLLERDKYENSSPASKATQQALSVYDAARMLMTTGEFSFILRQGKVGALSHPILTAKAIPDAIRAFMEDPAGAHAINLKTLNHPDMPAARAAKLHIVDEGAKLSRQEEMLVGAKLAEKIPVVGKLIGKFEQAATVFLNKLRFDMWDQMRKVGLSAAEEKQLAMFVNEATGRGGLGSLEQAAVPLARVMFSPRFFASRIQLATGHSLWGGTWATRRIIAGEYAKTLVGLGLYYGALKLAFSQGDKEVEIGTDPRSSDFGKVKVGNTRVDPLAGVAQVAVFAARTASGEKASTTGKVTDIRGPKVPFGGDRWSDVAARFARSKLHPVPGAVINLFDGTDLGGNEATLLNQGVNLSGPVTYVDIYQALEEQDLPEGVSISLLALLGEGVQTYGKKPKKAAK